jgi:hypothetical protein
MYRQHDLSNKPTDNPRSQDPKIDPKNRGAVGQQVIGKRRLVNG